MGGRLSRIDLMLPEGPDSDALLARASALLASG
jgi:hypothetical protein